MKTERSSFKTLQDKFEDFLFSKISIFEGQNLKIQINKKLRNCISYLHKKLKKTETNNEEFRKPSLHAKV